MQHSTLRAALAAATFVALAPIVRSDVLVVSPSGPYFDVQPAVDAAADGDVILVAPGTYTRVEIVGKALTLQGDPHALVRSFVVPPLTGTPGPAFTVRDLAADQRVVVRGLDVRLHYAEPYAALDVRDCTGSILFEDCDIASSNGDGVALGDTSSATFVRCTIHSDGPFLPNSSSIFKLNAGIRATHSDVFLHDCAISGSAGRDVIGFFDLVTSDGGPGLHLLNSRVFASGCGIVGGEGGAYQDVWAGPCVPLGDGGPGMLLESALGLSHVVLFDSVVRGGDGGQPDPTCSDPPGATGPDQIVQSGTVQVITGTRRAFGVESPLREGELGLTVYAGVPGDLVLLALSIGPGSSFLLQPYLVAPYVDPFLNVTTVRGVVPSGGVLVEQLAAPQLPPGVQSLGLSCQALYLDTTGAFFLGGPSYTVVVDDAF